MLWTAHLKSPSFRFIIVNRKVLIYIFEKGKGLGFMKLQISIHKQLKYVKEG